MAQLFKTSRTQYFQLSPTKKLFLLVSLSVILIIPVLSQSSSSYSLSTFAEKIYLQLDGKVYTTDKIIWFKAVVTNAYNHEPTTLSGVLYVELIGPNELIVEKKILKIENGIGEGFFSLNRRYSEGLYLIRAYTEWNKNFDNDFFFEEYIHVFAPASEVKEDPISEITLIEEQNNQRRLNVSFNPIVLDSLHKREIILYISFDEKKDTLSIKESRDGKYLFDYPIPDECQLVSMQIETTNQFSNVKTIALNKDYLDLQFFPESGELVHGIPGLVGFKAIDYNGKGQRVEGEIINQQGEIITFFKSNELGMGSFMLRKVESGQKYSARLLDKHEGKPFKVYPLPDIASKGNVLSVKKSGNNIRILASSSYIKNDSIYIQISQRGIEYYSIQGYLNEGNIWFSILADILPEGIFAFTMMDNSMNPIAERLYFNKKPESRLNIVLNTDKKNYMQRELTKLDINVSDSTGMPVNANLSVLVINKAQMGQIQDSRQNILTYFLLNSELRGEIENPGFYFRKDSRHRDLDALLLTQGWRKYNYTKPLDRDNLHFQPESTLRVSGSVGGSNFQKKNKQVALTMMTFGNNRSVQTQSTDSLGRFSFNVNDEFGQNCNILIQSANKSGKKKDYTIELDKKKSPDISLNSIMRIERVDSVVHAFVEKNIERKKIDDSFTFSSDNILIEEVTIEGYRMTPERKKVTEDYGKPDVIIPGEVIAEKEEEWSHGLFSVLEASFPDKIHIWKDRTGALFATVKTAEMTLFMVDGIPVRGNEYRFLPNIPPSEVESFEIIENAENFRTLFCELWPVICGAMQKNKRRQIEIPASGDIIAIYTHAGTGIFGTNRSEGILVEAIPVFSTPREFYTPSYQNLKPTDMLKPDLRALVHWEPEILVDGLGNASTSFYNADNKGKIQVVVEAISENGEIGYQEIFYDVVQRKY